MNSWKLNLALLILVVIMLLVVSGVFDSEPEIQPPLIAEQGAPTSITIHTPQRDCELQWLNQTWRVVKPVQAGVSDYALGKLLQLPQRSDYERVDSRDWAAFGLLQPALSIQFDQQLLEIGDQQSLNNKRYVRINQQTLVLLRDDFSMFAQDCPLQLVSKKLLPGSELLDLQLPKVHVFVRDGQWQIEPAMSLPSQDMLHNWLDQWRYAQAIQVKLVGSNAGASSEYSVRVTLQQQQLEFDAIRIGDQIWWRNSAMGLIYLLTPSSVENLLTPFSRPEPR